MKKHSHILSVATFLKGLLLSPLAPLFFIWEWISLTDREYIMTKSEKNWLIFERVMKSIIAVIVIIFLVTVVDSYPSSDLDDKSRGESCIPYGDCY